MTAEPRGGRAARPPGLRLAYPAELPVSERREEILAALRRHQVVVVAGETGSGKTTQLPKMCLEAGRGAGPARIAHTQPRRIAARSVAERLAEELGVAVGEEVGYQVRFRDHSGPRTRVKVMTDGILLAELQHDRDLRAYDTVIIDEAHERSLTIDFLLGYLKRLLPRRPDLSVVVTSATIDPHRFAAHFADADGRPAPVIEVSGRTYPVEVRYRPLQEPAYDEDGEPVVRDQTEAVVAACDELVAEGPGDILVFLPGEREIRDLADVLTGRSWGREQPEVVPLFARLTAAEQHRVFAPHRGRRIVLATNVAETSLTVPGIRYVVDSGVARISRYSARSKVQRLPVEPVSQASAKQRSGRCGRTEAGVAIRLYSEEDFESRPAFTDPEILRTNLASVLLRMAALRLGELTRFPFLDPPDSRQIAAGLQLLEELGALHDGRGDRRDPRRGRGLTAVGRILASLPVDPRLGRMVIEGERRGVLREVLVVAAALSLPDPRERPLEHQARADQLHARFRHPSSDFLGLLRLWHHVQEQQDALSSSAFRRLCRDEHLNYLRIREWQALESELRRSAKQAGLTTGKGSRRTTPPDQVDEDAVHQALLAGLLSHIGAKDPEERRRDDGARRGRGAAGRRPPYLGARGARFAIFPGSVLARRQPDLVMAAELVETSRLYARTNAAIKAGWAEELGAHLVKRRYSEPRWSRRRGEVVASETVTLYGVPLVAGRTVSYGRVDPPLARELFIRHALVQGEWRTRHAFFARNRRLLEEAEELEHRARRRDLVVDENTLFDFYDERVGADVVSAAHFDTWWKRARAADADLLAFDPAMLLHERARAIDAADYPDAWVEGDLALPLQYTFEPGSEDDGVTVRIPLATLHQVSETSLSWHVPGLREELVVALLRSLPKQLRTRFVPVPDHARDFVASVPAGEEDLLTALTRHLRARTGVAVPPGAWDWEKVPAHLRPTLVVTDESGAPVAAGKDLAALRDRLAPDAEEAVREAAQQHARSGETSWVFGTLPQTVQERRAGQPVVGHPALVDEGRSVGLTVVGREADRDALHARGVRRLVRLAVPFRADALVDGWDARRKLPLAASPYAAVPDLLEDCVLAAVDRLLGPQAAAIRDEAAFTAAVDRVTKALPAEAAQVLEEVARALEVWRDTDRLLSGRVDLPLLPAMTDMTAQVDRLLARGFVADGAHHLVHYPRYLRAVQRRAERLAADVERDRLLMARVAPLQDAYAHRVAALPAGSPPPAGLARVRWLLEELRVSLWAQQLGTAEPVSESRVRAALDRL